MILEPGTQGIFSKSTEELTKRQLVNRNFLFWKEKHLDFSNTTVQEALNELEKNYGAHFIVHDASISSKRITTSFQKETIEQIIAELKVLLDVEIIQSESTYHVRPN
ncbi:MAG: DUF4974 domain-containing protein [Flavobacterium sp.]|nr:MAG: DUF4974 domain-containing protein [Flavobacterium sp.]